MLDTSIQSDRISWHTVDNILDAQTTINESLSHNLIKGGKKIKRRTKVLNRELKKFAGLKSYSQYVRMKTAILRNISDNDDTDVEELLSAPPSLLLSSPNSNEESSSDTLLQSLPFPADEPLNLPSHKVKLAQSRRKGSRAKKSNLSRKKVPLKNNKLFVGGEKLRDSNDDTHSGKRDRKDEKNIGKLKVCSGARRNLTSLLESLDVPNPPIKEVQSRQIVVSGNCDNANMNNNNNNNSDIMIDNIVDHNNRQSQSSEIKIDGRIVQMTNVQPGDSGIDDDTQDNLSINNRAEDIIVHDEQQRNSQQDLEMRTEISSSHVDDGNFDMLVDVDNYQISEITAEEEQQQPIFTDDVVSRKSQPTITCTELVRSKYTIIRGENEKVKDEFLQDSSSNEPIIEDEEIADESTEMNKMSPELVKSKYMIIRGETEKVGDESSQDSSSNHQIIDDDESIDGITEEMTEMDKMSRETRRVSQMKRINLIYSSTESDSSEDDEISVKRAYSQDRAELFASQVISDPSDSDESVESIKMSQHIDDGSSSVTSLPLKIWDSNTDFITQQDNTPITGCEIKSIKSQIEEQECDDDNSPIVKRKKNSELEEKWVDDQVIAVTPSSSRRSSISETVNEQVEEAQESPRTEQKERSIVSSTIRPMPSDAESLQYVLNNLSTRSNNEVDHLLHPNGLFNNNNKKNNDNTRDENESEHNQHPDETLSRRPIDLHDFIAREGLIPTCELSTITLHDIIICPEQDDDEIYLMEIPRQIANDPQLCGKSILIENKSVVIGQNRYDITRRHAKSLSCILRNRNKKKARYKTVNVRPVGSIVVRHESTEKGISGVSDKKRHLESDMAAITDAENIVPFPKNLKSRNPLIAQQQNIADDDMKIVSPSNEKRRKNQKSTWQHLER